MQNNKYDWLIIVIIGAALFIPFLGSVHLFDWDEINFAESAREMILTGNYTTVQINFQPFWEKPPLFFWLQVFSMKAFQVYGTHPLASVEFVARFPNALTGIATLLTLFHIGKYLKNRQFGFIWVMVYVGSITPYLYFKTGIIDPIFNLFILLGIWFTYLFLLQNYKKYGILSGLFLGLSLLTKGPVGILIWGFTILSFYLLQPLPIKYIKTNFSKFIFIILIGFTVGSLWYIWEIYKNGFWFINEFISYQIRLLKTEDSGHGEPIYYHFLVVFFGCFPLSVFALKSFYTSFDISKNTQSFRKLMLCLFWVVMILFSLVQTKIVHYSSLAWAPLSFLAAYFIYQIFEEGIISKRFWIIFFIISVSIAILLSGIPWAGQHIELIKSFVKDDFAKSNMDAKVQWNGFEIFIGIVWLLAIILSKIIFSKSRKLSIIMIFGATAICMFFYTNTVIPKIEGYSQRAAIQFYQSLKGQNVYIEPIGFKSYAHLFYAEKQPITNKNSLDQNWLLYGNIDRTVYFITKINHQDVQRLNPQIKKIREENGFIFYCRKPHSNLF